MLLYPPVELGYLGGRKTNSLETRHSNFTEYVQEIFVSYENLWQTLQLLQLVGRPSLLPC